MHFKVWMILAVLSTGTLAGVGRAVAGGPELCTVRCTSGKLITFKPSSPCDPLECAFVCDQSGNGTCANTKNDECACGPGVPKPNLQAELSPAAQAKEEFLKSLGAVVEDTPFIVSTETVKEDGERLTEEAKVVEDLISKIGADPARRELARDLRSLARKYGDLGEALSWTSEKVPASAWTSSDLPFLGWPITTKDETIALIAFFKCTDENGTAVEIWGFNSCNKCDVNRGPGCKACCKHFTGNADDVRCSCK